MRVIMKFLFDDESFSFETLRAAGFANYGGADLGEILVTARAITEGDESSWHREWKATAERVQTIGEAARAAGHRVSAREALLRASNYYRTAEFFLRENPADDPEVARLSALSHDTFAAAAELLDAPVEAVRIPYQDTYLPGYLFLADGSGTPRPTVVYTSGYDSTLEEAYFAVAAAALRRGYNVLAYDGPGQGSVLRGQKLVFRPDWEAVVTPVLDFAVGRPEVDTSRIVLFGYSLGGYLVARAAAFEHRVAALILDDGIHDFHQAFAGVLPPALAGWIDEERDDVADPVLHLLTRTSTQIRWALRNGAWAMGTTSYADLVRKTRAYTLNGIADEITAPTLIMDAENDQFLKGQPDEVQKALSNAATTLVTLTEAEGAGEHCHMGAMGRAHQTMFDWLDTTLARTA
ncbi:alpha/beta fold hydrolase [Streptomyces sp. 35G-GA-8]|uniref:alpha/beta hydrolase family protein n=1 Tax=Streptomyces sp. 35G-GA-8 TaxID=2939434 RepID=UPI00201F5475|nr:alpha/beta fold hydrolase [Streptomyces sp. 35G-GA-8]MCL7377052.1 alpha/beta fold hydrolase [Streptomyces sp. 35G-GA-8]